MKKRTIYTFLFSLLSICLWAQPVADFTVSATEVCEGTPFTFTDASTGNALTYLWDFDDGETSTEQNPTHVFSMAGSFETCLTVTDDVGAMDTLCQSVIVNPASYNEFGVTVCAGEFYLHSCSGDLVGGGTHIVSCSGVNGCDSITTINVIELPIAQSELTVSYCAADACFNFTDGNCYNEGTHNVVFFGASFLGCDSVVILNVLEVSDLQIINAEIIDITCAGAADGNICITDVTCGEPPFTYDWSHGEVGSCAYDLAVGMYEVTITDTNGLTATESYTITAPNMMQISSLTTADVTCAGGNDGSIDLSIDGGTSPYTFSPTDLTNLAAGSYSFTITDYNGCSLISPPITINEPAPIELSITTTDATCGNVDGTIDLTVLGGVQPYTYTWNDGIYVSEDLSNLNSAFYFVDVMDANGCVAEIDVFLGQTGGPTVTYDVTPVDCFGGNTGSVDLTVTGGTEPFTFSWNDPTAQTTEDASGLTAGTYTVVITDDMNCSTVVTDIVVDDAELIVITTNVTNATCGNADGSIDVTVEGGTGTYAYLWSNNDTQADLSDLAEGTYILTVTDANGCTATAEATVLGGLILDAINTEVSCNGASDGSIDLSVSNGEAPFEYLWSNGMEMEDLSGLPAGLYMVTVTDANLCTGTVDIAILEPAPISFSINPVDPLCPGDLACIDASTVTGGSAPYTYLWSDGSTDVVNCLPAGSYSLTISDANGCTFASGNISITEPPLLQIETNVGCVSPGQADGSITVLVSGGTAPYLYEWENGATTAVIDNLTNGSYSITVTDANGCSVSNNVLLGIIEAMGPDTLGCSGGAEVFVIAPTAVSYSWEPATFLSDPTSSNPWASGMTDSTLFTVTVTNADGCEDTGSMWVEFPTGPGFILQPTDPDCGGGQSGSIDLFMVCPTTGPYTYDWADLPGADDPSSRTGLDAGSYVVTVTDANGETSVEAVTLLGGSPIIVTITGSATVCEDATLNLCASVTPGATYSWSGPSGFASFTECVTIANAGIGQSGCYTVVITDANGCTGEETFCVEVVLNNEIITYISLDAFICEGESTQLSSQLGPNAANITFEWTPGAEMDDPFSLNPIVTPSATTVYVLTAVDNTSGCEASESLIVNILPDCMWPGDTDTNKIVNNFDLLNIGLAYDSIGPERIGGNMLWEGQWAEDWMQIIPSGPNYKHIDSDGSGLINADDTLAITSNWGETHNFTGDPAEQFVHDYPQADGFVINAPFYVEADTLIEGMEMSLPIILGEEANVAEDVYGLAYSLTYDTEYIVGGSVGIGFNSSWLGENDNNMITIQRDFPSEGRVDIAMTRIDGTNISDYGQLAQLFITVEDDILFAPGGGGGAESFVDDAVFNITNVLVLNSEGEEIPVIPTETTAPVETTTSNNNIVLADLISIYPNPAKDRIWVATKNIEMESIRLYDLNGKLIRSTSKPSLDVQNISTGLYLLKVQTVEGVHVEKVMVK